MDSFNNVHVHIPLAKLKKKTNIDNCIDGKTKKKTLNVEKKEVT